VLNSVPSIRLPLMRALCEKQGSNLMKIKPLHPSDTGHEIISDSFLVTEIKSFKELMDLYDEFSEKYKDSSLLITLDDLGQAQYTSIHATMFHDLDDIEGHNLTLVDQSAFEDGEHKGYLSTKSEFFIREENFRAKAEKTDFLKACSRGLSIDDDELLVLEKINESPCDFLDNEVLIKIVPVKESSLALSAFPNSYFSSDLNPFENYALATHLSEKFGYEIFGIGASLIGFRRKENINKETARILSADLAKLYNRSQEDPIIERFSTIAFKNKHLFLKYVES